MAIRRRHDGIEVITQAGADLGPLRVGPVVTLAAPYQRDPQSGFTLCLKGHTANETHGGTEMNAGERAKAKAEQIVGKTVRTAAHAMHKETLAAKGAALEARGKMRGTKEQTKGSFKP
ncbi:hypothetical protein ABZ467_23750 [Streptomyces sp. NPDC005727]|uniref:hypothetical protein n=1 Tax=unclassified Streptomyces TaxID=2593676 RepID=UPI0033C9D3AE